jgi:hypothetical protein
VVNVAATAGTYIVGSVVVTLLLSTHWTTVQGRNVPWASVITRGVNGILSAGLPAAAEFGAIELRMGVGSDAGGVRVAGDTIVNGKVLDVPAELDTETVAVPGNAVSVGKIAAVS